MPKSFAQVKDKLSLKGRFTVYASKGMPRFIFGEQVPTEPGQPKIYRSLDLDFSKSPLISCETVNNIIVNQGKDQVVSSLANGQINPVARMCIGDRGTIPSDLTVPKTPLPTQTALNNEVYRADLDATILNVGTPTVHQVQFVRAFSSVVIPLSAFSNQASPVVNEVGLLTANLVLTPLPRPPVIAPLAPPADEALFATRTFNSVPFAAANEIAVTVRYTIFIE
jgi:hypothetical protein